MNFFFLPKNNLNKPKSQRFMCDFEFLQKDSCVLDSSIDFGERKFNIFS